MIPFDTNHSIPTRKSFSSIVPSAHQPALFLIHEGILFSIKLEELVWNKIIKISF